MASTRQPVTHNLRIWCYHRSEVQLLSFFYHRFDREVYDAMATCRGKVEGDKLNGVDPNMIKPARWRKSFKQRYSHARTTHDIKHNVNASVTQC